MTRKICSLLLILILSLSFAVPVFAASDRYVYDEAELLTSGEEAALEAKLEEIGEAYSSQLVVYTISSFDGDLDRETNRIYDEMGFGYGDSGDGVLLLVCMEPRQYRILSNGLTFTAIGMDEIDVIGNAVAPCLTRGDYTEAFDTFAEECAYYLEGSTNGFPFNFGKNLLICVAIAIVVAFIVTSILKGQLKSVRQQKQANAYVKAGSMQVTLSNDIFLYRNVSRVKKEPPKSSGSSGSSRGVGGGSF